MGGVVLETQCVPERVLSIRRIRGWVDAEPIRPRVDTRGYTRPLLQQCIYSISARSLNEFSELTS